MSGKFKVTWFAWDDVAGLELDPGEELEDFCECETSKIEAATADEAAGIYTDMVDISEPLEYDSLLVEWDANGQPCWQFYNLSVAVSCNKVEPDNFPVQLN